MAMSDIFDKHFMTSYEIIECYDLLASLLYSKECDKYIEDIKIILDNLKKLIKKESDKYNSIDLDDIKFYVSELSKIPTMWHDLVDFRIQYRLACVFDRLREYTINLNELFPEYGIDFELGIRDAINSKIEIDTYKLISKKLNELKLYDDKSIEFRDKLINLNNQYAVIKLSMRELEEIILLKANFDIDKMDDINLSIIEEKLFVKMGVITDIKDIIKEKVYTDVISLIDSLRRMILDEDDVNSIYDNLFLTVHLDILLDYLDINKLNEVQLYCDSIYTKNLLIKKSVNQIVRRKIDIYR